MSNSNAIKNSQEDLLQFHAFFYSYQYGLYGPIAVTTELLLMSLKANLSVLSDTLMVTEVLVFYQESNPLLPVLLVELDGKLILSEKLGKGLLLVASKEVKPPLVPVLMPPLVQLKLPLV